MYLYYFCYSVTDVVYKDVEYFFRQVMQMKNHIDDEGMDWLEVTVFLQADFVWYVDEFPSSQFHVGIELL